MSTSIRFRSRWLAAPAMVALLALSACTSAAAPTAPTTAPTAPAAAAPPTAAPTTAPTAAATPTAQAAPTTAPSTAPTAAASPAAAGSSEETVAVREDPKLGKILTDYEGKTLYRYAKDTQNSSACSGGCVAAWPPLTASGALQLPEGVTGTLGTITRSDGTKQVTYNGMPLYHFAKDAKPGDTAGQGIGGIWFVVAPGTSASAAAAPAATSSGY